MFDNIQSTLAPVPPTLGRIVCVFPSERHVKALQKLLGERISQEPHIGWDEFHAAPEDFPDKERLIWLEAHSTGEALLKLPAKTTFLAEDVFALADNRLIAVRDRSSRKWGVDDGLSADVFAGFQEALDSIEVAHEG